MGSGEFGGGGSVRWQVRYNDPHEPNGGGSGKPLRGHGKDKGADTEVGKKMRVTCKDAILVSAGGGTVVVDVTLKIDTDQVILQWGDEHPDSVARSATTAGAAQSKI
jgi:hypothetical protein